MTGSSPFPSSNFSLCLDRCREAQVSFFRCPWPFTSFLLSVSLYALTTRIKQDFGCPSLCFQLVGYRCKHIGAIPIGSSNQCNHSSNRILNVKGNAAFSRFHHNRVPLIRRSLGRSSVQAYSLSDRTNLTELTLHAAFLCIFRAYFGIFALLELWIEPSKMPSSSAGRVLAGGKLVSL